MAEKGVEAPEIHKVHDNSSLLSQLGESRAAERSAVPVQDSLAPVSLAEVRARLAGGESAPALETGQKGLESRPKAGEVIKVDFSGPNLADAAKMFILQSAGRESTDAVLESLSKTGKLTIGEFQFSSSEIDKWIKNGAMPPEAVQAVAKQANVLRFLTALDPSASEAAALLKNTHARLTGPNAAGAQMEFLASLQSDFQKVELAAAAWQEQVHRAEMEKMAEQAREAEKTARANRRIGAGVVGAAVGIGVLLAYGKSLFESDKDAAGRHASEKVRFKGN